MNKLNIYILFTTGFILALTSCKKKLDLKNPNAPSQVSIETPRAGISNWQTGEMARISGMLAQQTAMGSDPNQSYNQIYNNYVVSNSDYKYAYENAYSAILNPCSKIGSDEANLLSALTYVNLQQTFSNAYLLSDEGEEPLTEADIFGLLDPIISVGGTFSEPAKLVKAKYYLNNEMYSEALTLVSSFSETDSYTYASSGNYNNSTNWNIFRLERQTYLQTDAFGKSLFTGNDTLRYRAYFGYASDESVNNILQIDANHFLDFGNAQLTVDILGYVEAKLIEAECLARTSGNADAALNAALQANYASMGLSTSIAPSYSGATLDQVKTEIFKTMWAHPQILYNLRRWESEGFIPGFTEKVAGSFPDKHFYVVQ